MTLNYICQKCGKDFKQQKRFENHINNETNPCDLTCIGCGVKSRSRGSFRYHKTRCPYYIRYINCLTSTPTINNVTPTINNIDNSKTVNNNQNIVLLQPFDIDHYYMKKEETIGSRRDEIVKLLKSDKYSEAYECLFKEIHGNTKHPERHNIYLPHIDKAEIAVFRGYSFTLDTAEKTLPRMYYRLKHEMDWLVKTAKSLNENERSQLRWNIQANWMQINESDDPEMKRILLNNKNIVLNTLKNNIVKIDKEMLNEWNLLKTKDRNPRIPSPSTIDKWMDKNGLKCSKDKVIKLSELPV